MVVRKFKPLMIEAVVRGYIIGSGWKDYQKTGRGLRDQAACRTEGSGKTPGSDFHAGHQSTGGASMTKTLPTPKRKKIVGAELAAKARAVSVQLYTEAARVRRKPKASSLPTPNSSSVPTTRASCT